MSSRLASRAGRAVGLGEGLALGVVTVGEDVGVDGVAQLLPAVGGTGQVTVLAQRFDHAIGADPGHDLGVGEVPALAAHLPETVVGLIPGALEMVHQRELKVPRVVVVADPRVARQRQSVQRLAPDVELKLVRGGIADTDGRRVLITGQPRQLGLRQPPGAVEGVHDLEVGGITGDRAQQPLAPCFGLVVIPGGEQCLERRGGVAQPAVAVIPVARAPELLG